MIAELPDDRTPFSIYPITADLMDLMGILVWLVVLITLGLLIWMIVKTVKEWGALHVVLMALLFIEVWCFMFFTAGVASRRNGYMKANDVLQKRVAEKERELDKLRNGDKFDPNPDMNSYITLTNALNRLNVERGRVWRGASVTGLAQGEATLQLGLVAPIAPNVQDPGAEPGAAPAANPAAANAPAAPATDTGLAAQTIVHVFGETNDQRGLLPSVYLGEFVVSDSTGGIIKIKPTGTLTPEQIAAIGSGQYPSWSIYELMPLDSHDAFAAEGSKTEENAIFGRMDLNELASLLQIDPALATAEPTGLSVKDAIRARVLQSYINDGARPPEGTPPEQVYVQVEFLKDHPIEVDAQEQRNATEGGFYDLSGRSVDARLKRGEDGAKVDFKQGDRIVFDSATANDLGKQDIVKPVSPVFVRQLNDYEYAFREVRRQITAALQDAVLIRRELEEMQKSQGIADNQVRLGQDERSKLDKDFAQYKKELDVISSEATRLQEEVQTTRSETSATFKQIQALRDQIVARQKALSDAINALSGAPNP
jgi:cell division protein FtsB